MRVTYQTFHRQAVTAIETASQRLVDLQRQVSTGRRIDRASQDPAAAAAAIVERGRAAATDVYTSIGTTAQSRLMVADTVLSDLGQQLTAAQVAVAGARGSTVTPNQREAHARELEALRDAVLRDMNTTVDGVYLFGGAAGTSAPYTKNPADVVSGYQGSAQEVAVDVDAGIEVTVGFDGHALTQGGDANDLFVEFDNAIAAVRGGDAAGLNAASTALERALARVGLTQSRVGTSLQRIDDARVRLGEEARGTTARLTAIEGADMAAAISGLAQADTVYRAALGATAQINRPSLMDYLR
jgi:flagellar hook-associated protein 3 FlgL